MRDGSIGIQHGRAWSWGIDTVIPMRALETQGKGKDRRDCMRQFKAAWERFAADEANLIEVPEREVQATLDRHRSNYLPIAGRPAQDHRSTNSVYASSKDHVGGALFWTIRNLRDERGKLGGPPRLFRSRPGRGFTIYVWRNVFARGCLTLL